MQVWQAFGGYQQVMGALPTARTVRRVRLYLAAVNEYQAEQQKELEEQAHEQERERNRANSG